MSECENRRRVALLHDGELSAQDAADVERHITECLACAEERFRLAQESELFARHAEGASNNVARFHDAFDGAFDDAANQPIGVLRLAGTFAGLAASVAIVGLVWLHEIRPESSAAVGPRVLVVATNNSEWERLATNFELESRPLLLPDPAGQHREMLADAAIANWMVAQLDPELSHDIH